MLKKKEFNKLKEDVKKFKLKNADVLDYIEANFVDKNPVQDVYNSGGLSSCVNSCKPVSDKTNTGSSDFEKKRGVKVMTSALSEKGQNPNSTP